MLKRYSEKDDQLFKIEDIDQSSSLDSQISALENIQVAALQEL